jgi:pyridoxamine 5'-phosphate oxidase
MTDHVSKATQQQLSDATNPFALFQSWYADAAASEPNDPNAIALATVDADGLPNVRMVLLKGLDEPTVQGRGFVFYTNFDSAKGQELRAQPKAALLCHWKSRRRQIRVRGSVSIVSDAEADTYFESRPRLSRIGAWASSQSSVLESREALEAAVSKYTTEFGTGAIPRPANWSGFRVTPVEIEFWNDGAFRLHDRIVFRRQKPTQPWSKTRLFP